MALADPLEETVWDKNHTRMESLRKTHRLRGGEMNGGLCTKEGWQQVMSWKPGKESNKESTSTKRSGLEDCWIGKFKG